MKYSKPNLHGLGGPAGQCADGSAASNSPDAGIECINGFSPSGRCETGPSPGLFGTCSTGDGDTAHCSMGIAAGDPASCGSGTTHFPIGENCVSGSSPT